jgi:hypothetical protein
MKATDGSKKNSGSIQPIISERLDPLFPHYRIQHVLKIFKHAHRSDPESVIEIRINRTS